MCEVCAVFGIGQHWTEAAQRSDARMPAPDIARHRRERRSRIALLNALMAGTGVVVADWDGESYWVEARSGRGERVPDLCELWRAIERAADRSIDPLVPGFTVGR
jgi:hypothetical protein